MAGERALGDVWRGVGCRGVSRSSPGPSRFACRIARTLGFSNVAAHVLLSTTIFLSCCNAAFSPPLVTFSPPPVVWSILRSDREGIPPGEIDGGRGGRKVTVGKTGEGGGRESKICGEERKVSCVSLVTRVGGMVFLLSPRSSCSPLRVSPRRMIRKIPAVIHPWIS